MKKTILLSLFSILFLFSATDSKAQDSAYQKGQLQINAGIDFLVFPYSYAYFGNYNSVSTSSIIPITANIEYGMHKYISIGAYGGFYSKTWTYNFRTFNEERKSRFTVISLGARGTLHATQLMNEISDAGIDAKKWDLYASLILGTETTTWSHNWEDERYSQPSTSTSVRFGPILGARYMFNPNFGAFLEFGRGTYGLGRIGLSFNI